VNIIGIVVLLLSVKVTQALTMQDYTSTDIAQVAIAKIESDVETAVRQAISQAGGLTGTVGPGDVVVVKPNLVLYSPANSGIVTDPAIVRAIVRLAREAGAAQVIIAEGTAGDEHCDRSCTQTAFRVAGYDVDGDMTDDITGALLVDLNDAGGTDVYDTHKVTRMVVPTGLIRKEYWLPNIVLNADVLISVPVLKNHFLAGVTLGMKNLIGLLPNDLYHAPGLTYGKHSLSPRPLHLDLHLVDVNLVRRPDFVVIDGQRGMIDGPIGSQIINPPMGIILAGRDVVAVDTVGTLVMGYDPISIPYIGLGARTGLGTTDASYIRVIGAPLAQVRRDFPSPYADSPVRRADMQPPTVTINVPSKGAQPNVTTILVDASDNDTVARVELYVDHQRVGQALKPPYQFRIDSSQYPAGRHTLRVIAYDRCLNQTQSSLEIYFAAPTATDTPTPLPTATATPSSTNTATPLSTETSIPATATTVPLLTNTVPPPPTVTPAPQPSTPISITTPIHPSRAVTATATATEALSSIAIASPTLVSLRTERTPETQAIAPTDISVHGSQRPFSYRLAWVLSVVSALLMASVLGIWLGIMLAKWHRGQKRG
jgi:uncharacterized protein (DUF362 family)